ncbi:MAG: endonuclease NucS [Methanocellales archaeon]
MPFIINPEPEEALAVAKSSTRAMLVIIGNCKVDYSGRAKSTLDYGERLVIVKRDGTVIVHQDINREPVNWMPPDTRVKYEVEDQKFILKAARRDPIEHMKISFKEICLITSQVLKDFKRIKIAGMENQLVEEIARNPSIIELGLRIVERERTTASGEIDLYGVDRNGTPVIIEVKRSSPSINAVQQLHAYILDLKKHNKAAKIRGILVAPKIPEMIKTLLREKELEYREFNWQFELHGEGQRTLDEFEGED